MSTSYFSTDRCQIQAFTAFVPQIAAYALEEVTTEAGKLILPETLAAPLTFIAKAVKFSMFTGFALCAAAEFDNPRILKSPNVAVCLGLAGFIVSELTDSVVPSLVSIVAAGVLGGAR